MSMLSLISAAVLVLSGSPAPPTVPVAPFEVVAAPWWETYDAGLRAIDRSDWRAAITALEEAVRQNSKSNAKARTYGMRFIAYFPYYYLGVAHYNLGEVDEALTYFRKEEQSGAVEKSERHQGQLEVLLAATEAMRDERERRLALLREPKEVLTAPTPDPLPSDPVPAPLPPRGSKEREELKESLAPVPSDPPRIAIVAPSNQDEAVEVETIQVHGVVVDKYGIAEVSLEVNGELAPRLQLGSQGGAGGGFLASAASDTVGGSPASLGTFMNFASDVSLQKGVNRVVVRARNVNGIVMEEVREIRRSK